MSALLVHPWKSQYTDLLFKVAQYVLPEERAGKPITSYPIQISTAPMIIYTIAEIQVNCMMSMIPHITNTIPTTVSIIAIIPSMILFVVAI